MNYKIQIMEIVIFLGINSNNGTDFYGISSVNYFTLILKLKCEFAGGDWKFQKIRSHSHFGNELNVFRHVNN